MLELTDEMKIDYLKSGGDYCPFCGSQRITSDQLQINGEIGYRNTTCQNCDAQFVDTFTLTGVEVAEIQV